MHLAALGGVRSVVLAALHLLRLVAQVVPWVAWPNCMVVKVDLHLAVRSASPPDPRSLPQVGL
jgi:hypothetical protein